MYRHLEGIALYASLNFPDWISPMERRTDRAPDRPTDRLADRAPDRPTDRAPDGYTIFKVTAVVLVHGSFVAGRFLFWVHGQVLCGFRGG